MLVLLVVLAMLLPVLQSEYTFRVQMLEIYNENLRDLLVDGRGGVNRLDILATQASGCNVPGATQVRSGWGSGLDADASRSSAQAVANLEAQHVECIRSF